MVGCLEKAPNHAIQPIGAVALWMQARPFVRRVAALGGLSGVCHETIYHQRLDPTQITNIVHMKPGGRLYSQSTLTMCVLAVVCLATSCLSGHATVSNYTSFATFESVVGPQPLIRFTEVPLGTAPTDEYASFGVRFLYDANNETESDPGAYLTDGIGLAGGNENHMTFIRFVFDNPVHSLGVDFPGTLHIDLFSGSTLVGASTNLGESGYGHFAGVVSDVPFDRVVLSRIIGDVYRDVYIDNLHVPEPRLGIRSLGSSEVQLSWTTNAPSFHFEHAESLPATIWSAVTNSPSIVGSEFAVASTNAGMQR